MKNLHKAIAGAQRHGPGFTHPEDILLAIRDAGYHIISTPKLVIEDHIDITPLYDIPFKTIELSAELDDQVLSARHSSAVEFDNPRLEQYVITRLKREMAEAVFGYILKDVENAEA